MSQISQTLADGLAVLRVIHAGSVTRSEIAAALGLERTKVYRLLGTLEAGGFVARRDNGEYGLTALMAAMAPEPYQWLQEVAQAPLTELARTTAMTAHLTVCDGRLATAVSVVNPPSADLYVAYRQGSTHPIDRAAAGLAVLCRRSGEAETVAARADVAPVGYVVTRGHLQHGAVGLAIGLDLTGVEASVGVVAIGEIDEAIVAPYVLEAKAELEALFARFHLDREPPTDLTGGPTNKPISG